MLNKVMIIGRLGADPELRYAGNGTPIANFNVATDESYTDREGNKQDRTEWHRVVVFQRVAENCANYLGKGSLVYVEGSLQTRQWQDQQGQTRYTTEIKAQRVQFLDRKGDAMQQGGERRSFQQNNAPRPQQNNNFQPQQQQYNSGNEDLGPAFPSEASGMDDVPF
ncbi:single-stranded DNA-binding protein [Halodesulfovibrio spirochaetisodalis]|uniref:Single-stranded DNA-binding protein n=1 Tax=Halodesulfovibrio spirochaetisodalis TaxID=1560234 RepID=A0A1B7XC94_9BACT|nr:single-stranded DNA-binding protein [Halodesulfovibrio spirochaetisodalis]OBQ51566.1 single-stranded DNA-binding protein [Halodesulfovibrio spirochaetisodalis]